MFSQEFITQLPPDPLTAGLSLCDAFDDNVRKLPPTAMTANYVRYLAAYAALSAFFEIHELEIPKDLQLKAERPNTAPSEELKRENISIIEAAFASFRVRLRDDRVRAQGRAVREQILSKYGGFSYEFSEGDLDRIQVLINELRNLLASDTHLSDEHRQRVLRRLERLQGELHKKMSDIDRLWGLIGDAGVLLGKFGKDAKPLVDRIREITDIAWRSQARAEELPSNAKPALITDKSTDELSG